jgi:hypothetical protein
MCSPANLNAVKQCVDFVAKEKGRDYSNVYAGKEGDDYPYSGQGCIEIVNNRADPKSGLWQEWDQLRVSGVDKNGKIYCSTDHCYDDGSTCHGMKPFGTISNGVFTSHT